MSEIKLHHLPPGIFDKNTRLIQMSVTLFFFLCEPCLLNFNLIFVKKQSKIESESCNASINKIKKCANLVFIIWSYLRTKEINLQLIQLVNFRTSGLKTLISDQLHNSCKGLQLLFVVVVVLLNLSDHSFCFAI